MGMSRILSGGCGLRTGWIALFDRVFLVDFNG